jgi:hypothetical protein
MADSNITAAIRAIEAELDRSGVAIRKDHTNEFFIALEYFDSVRICRIASTCQHDGLNFEREAIWEVQGKIAALIRAHCSLYYS